MSAEPSGIAAAPTFSAAVRDRSTALLFVLGLATGIPAGWGWYGFVYWNGYAKIEQALWLVMTALGLIGLIALIAAPFLDRFPAPLFRRLGHRRSWVTLAMCCAFGLNAISTVAEFITTGFATILALLAGIVALPVMALLWISLDALRIELRPGRAQAVALAAQYLGALTSAAIVAHLLGEPRNWPVSAIVFAPLLALGIIASFSIAEPAPGAMAARDRAPGVLGLLIEPCSAFRGRFGSAGMLLLASIAFYALGASLADYLGKLGYVVDVIGPVRPVGDASAATKLPMALLEVVVAAIGGLGGMLIAFRLAPARAFMVLQYLLFAFVISFLVCRLFLGFDVLTVALLFAVRTLLFAAGLVIYGVVTARLTARPHTASQFALFAVLAALFWISEAGLYRLAPTLGSYAVSVAALIAALFAIDFMYLARRRIMQSATEG